MRISFHILITLYTFLSVNILSGQTRIDPELIIEAIARDTSLPAENFQQYANKLAGTLAQYAPETLNRIFEQSTSVDLDDKEDEVDDFLGNTNGHVEKVPFESTSQYQALQRKVDAAVEAYEQSLVSLEEAERYLSDLDRSNHPLLSNGIRGDHARALKAAEDSYSKASAEVQKQLRKVLAARHSLDAAYIAFQR